MIIIEQTTDLAGKIRMIAQLSDGSTVNLKFAEQPSEAMLEEIESTIISSSEYADVQQEEINILEHKELIVEFIMKVKTNPTVTLAQYNTWLNTKIWYEQCIVRFFVFKLATTLANKTSINLPDYTEGQILGRLRDWIVDTPLKKIGKIVFNNTQL